MMAIRRDQLQRYSVTGKINAELFPWLHMNYSMKYMRKDYSKPTAMTDNTLYQNISKRWPMEPTVDLMDINGKHDHPAYSLRR